MKPPKKPGKTQAPPPPLNPQQFPLQAQTDATTGRDEVRAQSHVPAPRESKRPAERSGKSRGGN